MTSYQNKQISINNLLSNLFETLPKSKKTIDQQDNESLNTMDYYKEENSSRNMKLDENNMFYNKKFNKINKTNNFRATINFKSTTSNQMPSNFYEFIDFTRGKSLFSNKNEKNVKKRFEDIKNNNNYCSKCNSEIDYTTKVCKHCFKPLCRKCLTEIYIRNLDNNNDSDNCAQNTDKENICPFCKNITSFKDYVILKSKTSKNTDICLKEPLDTSDGEISSNYSIEKSEKNINRLNNVFSKDLEEQYNEYNSLLKQIEGKKKDIEIKKNININILQIMQKTIEYEYNLNMKKLNDLSLKLNKIQKAIKNKIEKYSRNNNYVYNNEIQNIIKTFKNTINVYSKNYEKLNQKLISKTKPKAFKLYEAKPLSINLSNTYYMKNTEILSNHSIGKAYIKVDRFVNNYVNYLNFSVSINQDNKNSQTNNNIQKKSQLVVYMIVNNKLFRFNKNNKDNNKDCLNFECPLEETKAFISKIPSNKENINTKNDEFEIKLIITEVFL